MSRLRWAFVVHTTIALGLGLLPQVRGEEATWVGKVVITKKPGVKIHYTDETGLEHDRALGGTAYTVKAEKGKSIQVQDRDVCGWLDTRMRCSRQPRWIISQSEYVAIRTTSTLTAVVSRARLTTGDLDLALQDYDKAISLDPTVASWRRLRGFIWHTKGEYDKAIADYTKAIRLDPHNDTTHFNRARAWSAKGDCDKALADCDEAVRLAPKNVEILVGRGRLWEAKKDVAKAMADYAEAIRLDTKSAAAYQRSGHSLAQKA